MDETKEGGAAWLTSRVVSRNWKEGFDYFFFVFRMKNLVPGVGEGGGGGGVGGGGAWSRDAYVGRGRVRPHLSESQLSILRIVQKSDQLLSLCIHEES